MSDLEILDIRSWADFYIACRKQNYIDYLTKIDDFLSTKKDIIKNSYLIDAIRSRYPIEVIKMLNTYNKENIKLMNDDVGVVDTYHDYLMKTKYNLEYILSYFFGRAFRKMYDDDIKDIEYALKLLEIFEIEESSINWDYCLKKGIQR